jgi:hypothetical protein
MSFNADIGFVGDLLICDQPICYGFGVDSIHRSNYSLLFSNIKPHLQKFTHLAGNFEAVIKAIPHGGGNVSNYSMCCSPEVASALAEAGFTILSVANNHSMDYGQRWFDETTNSLEKAGIEVIGIKNNPGKVVNIRSYNIAVIGASYLPVKNNKPAYLSNPSFDTWKEIADSFGQCHQKIAFVHWGNEFVTLPNEMQLKWANEMLDAGIDIIVGCHSHVLQPSALIRGKPVFFSLGNFVSDYWQLRFRRTCMVGLDLENVKSPNVANYLINCEGTPEYINADYISLREYNGNASLKNEIALARWRMRIEYGIYLLKNAHRIKAKRHMIKWLAKRFSYILRYAAIENQNPEVIYKNYDSGSDRS